MDSAKGVKARECSKNVFMPVTESLSAFAMNEVQWDAELEGG